MNRGLLLVVQGLVFVALLAGCGNGRTLKVTPPPSRGTWVANVSVGTDLQRYFKDTNKVEITNQCFQLVELADGNKTQYVEYSTEACPDSGLTKQARLRFFVQPMPDENQLGKPTEQFYLYQDYIPVGLMKANNKSFMLVDLCSLAPEYRASCIVKAASGALTEIEPVRITPALRMVRERQFQKEAEALRAETNNLKSKLIGQTGVAKASAETLKKQKESVIALIKKYEARRAGLQKAYTEVLNGAEKKQGIEKDLAETRTEVEKLNKAIAQRQENELKQLGEAVSNSKKAYEEAMTSAKLKAREYQEKSEKLASLSGEQKEALEKEIAQIKIDIGPLYLAAVGTEEAFSKALKELNESEVGKADAADREKLTKLKAKIGLLQEGIPQIKERLETITKMKKALEEIAGSVNKDAPLDVALEKLSQIGVMLEFFTPRQAK